MLDATQIALRMGTDNPPRRVWDVLDPALLAASFPELLAARQTLQRGGTVYDHTMAVLDHLEVRNEVTVWSAVFHDVGKTAVSMLVRRFSDGFTGHEILSETIARRLLGDWAVTRPTVESVARIVRTHMADVLNGRSPRAIRRFIAGVGQANLEDWFVVRRADALAYGRGDSLPLIESFRAHVRAAVESGEDWWNLGGRPQMAPIAGKDRLSGSIDITLKGAP